MTDSDFSSDSDGAVLSDSDGVVLSDSVSDGVVLSDSVSDGVVSSDSVSDGSDGELSAGFLFFYLSSKLDQEVFTASIAGASLVVPYSL